VGHSVIQQLEGKLRPPEKLTSEHHIEGFCSGEEVLDNWLKKRALKNESSDASRTYVVCIDNNVVGYYTLAVGSICHEQAIGKLRRNMPNPIPVMVLGRLAVDATLQGRGIGPGMLRDAVFRTQKVAEIAAIKAILVHAISDRAKTFYEDFGFQVSPVDPMTLMVTLKDIEMSLSSPA